jgi:hypothetical protein
MAGEYQYKLTPEDWANMGPQGALKKISEALTGGINTYNQQQLMSQKTQPKQPFKFTPGKGFEAIGEPVPQNAMITPSENPMELEKMKLEYLTKQQGGKDAQKQKTFEMQAGRNADMSASKDAMRLSGSTGSPVFDAILKIPPMNAKAYGYTKTIMTIKNLIDNGFERKAFEMIKSDYGLSNDIDAKRRLLAIKNTPKEKIYEEIPNIKPVTGAEAAKQLGKFTTGAQSVDDLFKRWEQGITPDKIVGYNIPENPQGEPAAEAAPVDTDIWGEGK